MKVNFSISTKDVKLVCDREGLKYLSKSDYEHILKDTEKYYASNIKKDISQYVYAQAFNHLNELKKEYNNKKKGNKVNIN